MTLAHLHDVTDLAADIRARRDQSQRRKQDALAIRDLHQIAHDMRQRIGNPERPAAYIVLSSEEAMAIIDQLEALT